MKFVLYSDKNYEYQVQNFLDSATYAGLNNQIIYFTIGFESSIIDERLLKFNFQIDDSLPNFRLYAPRICLEAIKLFDDDFCYVDTDIILSKRFKFFDFDFSTNYPICCKSPVEYPYTYLSTQEGEIIIKNETKLMNYFNIKERSMFYVYSCFFSFNKNSKDFLEEWMSICENKYFLRDSEFTLPFGDETALNIVYWRRGINHNYGHKFINTHKLTTFNMCENDEKILNTNIDNNMYEFCENSNEIYFYHGYKDINAKENFNL